MGSESEAKIRDVVSQPRTQPPAQPPPPRRPCVNTWMSSEIKAWLEAKGTANALCGTFAVNRGFDHRDDECACRRIAAALLNEAIETANA